MGKNSGTNSGLGGFVNGGSIRFSRYKNGSGGVDAWRDQLMSQKTNHLVTRKRTTGTKMPILHSIHQAIVTSMQWYGCFVQLGDGETYKDGMLHVSNVGTERIEDPREAGLELGAKLWVKINDINEKEFKYGVDMRYVSQRDGKDLDPYNGKSKVPDNFWYKGIFVKNQPKADESEEEPAAPAAASSVEPLQKKQKTCDDSSDASTVSSSVKKKLKKARKKMEKMRKKAEKIKKKAGKDDGKKRKKSKKKSSDSNASPAASSHSS